jgi:predicted NBD/HSP70 family sugar kinase
VEHYLAAAPGKRHPPSAPVRFEDLLRRAGTGEPRAVETLDRQAHFLGVGLATIVTGLAPQVVVVIGEVTSAWDRVGPIVNDVIARRGLRETPSRVIPTDHTTQPRLRGAVTLVVQQHFGVPNVA